MSKPLVIFQDRVREHDPFTRLDQDNFSYKEIANSETVRILSGQQMIVSDQVRVDGFLFVAGEAYVTQIKQIDPEIVLPPDNFSYFEVESTKTVTVPQSQQMYLLNFVRVDGFLVVEGEVAVGNSCQEPEPERLVAHVISGKTYIVKQDEEYSFRNFLKINGEVKNQGFITIGV